VPSGCAVPVAYLSSVTPAEAGIQRPKTRRAPWIPACEVVKKLFGWPIRDSLSGN